MFMFFLLYLKKLPVLIIALSCRYLPGPDDVLVLDIGYMIYMKFEEYPRALQIALFLDNMQVVNYKF